MIDLLVATNDRQMVKQRIHVAIYSYTLPEGIEDITMLDGMVKQALIHYNDFDLTKITWISGQIIMKFGRHTSTPTYPNAFTLTYDGEPINFIFMERFHV